MGGKKSIITFQLVTRNDNNDKIIEHFRKEKKISNLIY